MNQKTSLFMQKVLENLKVGKKNSTEVTEITTSFLYDCIRFWNTLSEYKDLQKLENATLDLDNLTSNPNRPNGSFDYPVTKKDLEDAKQFSKYLLERAVNKAIAEIAQEC